jgi:hypothetical protein
MLAFSSAAPGAKTVEQETAKIRVQICFMSTFGSGIRLRGAMRKRQGQRKSVADVHSAR